MVCTAPALLAWPGEGAAPSPHFPQPPRPVGQPRDRSAITLASWASWEAVNFGLLLTWVWAWLCSLVAGTQWTEDMAGQEQPPRGTCVTEVEDGNDKLLFLKPKFQAHRGLQVLGAPQEGPSPSSEFTRRCPLETMADEEHLWSGAAPPPRARRERASTALEETNVWP